MTEQTMNQISGPSINDLAPRNFSEPNLNTPQGPTTFTPDTSENLFLSEIDKKFGSGPQAQAMQLYADQVKQMVEKAYTDYGYQKNDMGVAFAALLETSWEISNGSFKLGTGRAEDQEKTRTVVRQMQNALLSSSAFAAMPERNKQLFYESCTFLSGHLATLWQQVGNNAAQKAEVQQEARQQLRGLLGFDADALTRRPDGAFISTMHSTSADSSAGYAATVTNNSAPVAAAPVPQGELPPAMVPDAQIFIQYVFTGTTTRFDHLILFSNGAAFTEIPSKPATEFSEATLRASLKPFDIGTWEKSGENIILRFPDKSREPVITLRPVPRGWYDGDDEPDPDSGFGTYFPIIPIKPEQILGPWETQSLTTMGFVGGGAPMVAAGSSGDRVFHADGTYSGGKESFASSTTANMGDAFKTGGDVGTYGTNKKSDAGRWRLDGPLLTLESNGQRTVSLAFVLPEWSKDKEPHLLIDGDWWKRPEKK